MILVYHVIKKKIKAIISVDRIKVATGGEKDEGESRIRKW